jgi:hypothetical protein
MPHLLGIEWVHRAFNEGASKLAHSRGFASGKNCAALAGTAVLQEKHEYLISLIIYFTIFYRFISPEVDNQNSGLILLALASGEC